MTFLRKITRTENIKILRTEVGAAFPNKCHNCVKVYVKKIDGKLIS